MDSLFLLREVFDLFSHPHAILRRRCCRAAAILFVRTINKGGPAMRKKSRAYNPYTKAITSVEYGGLQKAYDFFKDHLFKERWLPDVFITYQRQSRTRGYFSPD